MGRFAPIAGDDGFAGRPVGGDDDAGGLLPVIRRLAGARSQHEVMAAVSHGVRDLLHADGASFVLRRGDRCYYAEEDSVSPLWKGRLFPMSACISGWCMTNNRSVAIPDIYKDPRVPVEAYRPTFVRSLAMAPVALGLEAPVAALGAYWSETHQPRPEELERLQAIADAAALAVANIEAKQPAPRGWRAPVPPPPRESREPEPAAAAARSQTPRAFIRQVRLEGLRPNSPAAFGFAALCILIATLVRLAVQSLGVQGVVPFSLYYPAAALAVVVGGRWAGVLASVLGGLAAYWFFMPPLYVSMPITAREGLDMALYAGACVLIILIVDGYKRAVQRFRQEDARHLTLAREQHHRVRNAAAVCEAIVKLSLRDEPERAKAINRRIRAGLAEIDIKDRGQGQPSRLRDLLCDELQPYDLSRFALEGAEDAALSADARALLVLAVHELTTNALKYGALSVPEGRIAVSWRTLDGRTAISWRESGGPPVEPPKRRGYGSIMLSRLVEAAGGALTLDFPPAGAIAEIILPPRPA